MADQPTQRRGFLARLFTRDGVDASAAVAPSSSKSASPSTAVVPVERKSSLLPRGAYFPGTYEFFSPDGGHTILTDLPGLNGNGTALAFVAYWYCATRWRAQKIAEAPVMVVEEDKKDGSEEWLPDHELAQLLDMPSDDYDMGELLERTSRYLDNTAECLWVLDKNRLQQIARVTPFKGGEFEIVPVEDRLYGRFKVQTKKGPEYYDADQVVYFRDNAEGWTGRPKSRLDVAMSWLRLGEHARVTIRDLLGNAVWPSGVAIPDKEWNPTEEQLEMYKAELESYAAPGNKGRPFAMLGGGTFEALSARIRDLVPEEVLNRVESVVAAVSGVPAIVLQFQVGMENSPWSQMGQARRMAYDDTIQPTWRKLERVMTRQLLRPVDDDPTHFIRFDKSNIASLQDDLTTLITNATMMGRAASLNERRMMMKLEPVDDPAADEIPELAAPILPPGLLGGGAEEDDEEEEEEETDDTEETEEEDDEEGTEEEKTARRWAKLIERKKKVARFSDTLRDEGVATWVSVTKRLIQLDQEEIRSIVNLFLVEATLKNLESKERGKQRVMTAVVGYLKETAAPRWARATTPLLVQAAQRSTAVIAADLSINYNLLHPGVLRFAQKESSFLIDGITKTTRDSVAAALARGLEEGASTSRIAEMIAEAGAFSKDRSMLIARTETARTFNGAPTYALNAIQNGTGRKFVKTWSTALDDRVRDEHIALEGETVEINSTFSNGVQYPSEPNCRCTVLYTEVET